jgi:hypothetical protein
MKLATESRPEFGGAHPGGKVEESADVTWERFPICLFPVERGCPSAMADQEQRDASDTGLTCVKRKDLSTIELSSTRPHKQFNRTARVTRIMLQTPWPTHQRFSQTSLSETPSSALTEPRFRNGNRHIPEVIRGFWGGRNCGSKSGWNSK